ncbi:MAG TPA: class I SAM-dependent methyltransferase [Bacteroidia bacterium]|nr:class I SAM-dependent methyltransferase [Bacteroidia bacterium]
MREEKQYRFSDYSKIDKADHYYLVYKPLIRDLEFAVKKYGGERVLDIGCGNKPYEGMFQGIAKEYVGCDVVQSDQSRVDVICEATKIPLPDSGFDTVFSTQVIEHVEDHQALVKEAFRLLKPGGHFIVSGPMYWHLHEEPYDFFRFTKHGFKYILEKNGFNVMEILSNGGKWALMGQVIIHTMPARLVGLRLYRIMVNRIFSYLDKKYFNDFNTMNYVVVGKKEEKA